MNVLIRRLVPTKVFQQRCYEFYEPSLGGLDAPLTSRSSLFWIPTPIRPRRPQIALMACRTSFRFARRLLPYVYHYIFSERMNDIECHIRAPLRAVNGTDLGIYIPPTKPERSFVLQTGELHDRVCLRGTTLLGMPDMDIHFLGLPSLHCVGCFRGALCLFVVIHFCWRMICSLCITHVTIARFEHV